jgi:hypothetical protein
MLLPSAGAAAGVLTGMAVGFHTTPAKLWMRALAALVTAGLVLVIALVGASTGLVVLDRESIWFLPAGVVAGGLASHLAFPFATRLAGKLARVFPLGLGTARAAIWLPLALVLYVALVYAVAAALVALVFAIALVIALGLVVLAFRIMTNSSSSLGFGGFSGLSSGNGGSGPSAPEPRAVVHTDARGDYAGRTNVDGSVVDAQGNFAGRVDAQGNRTDQFGNYVGRTNADGSRVDARGNYVGRVNQDGSVVDAHGDRIGKGTKQ